jgi:hypothetical protein
MIFDPSVRLIWDRVSGVTPAPDARGLIGAPAA